MTTVLHLQAQPDAPIACDMSTAPDTPDERLAEYHALFERALLRRDRRGDAVVFWFRADPGIRETVDDLARREHACCPFFEFRIESVGGEVVWTTINTRTGDERAGVDVILDAFHALPDHAGSDLEGYLGRLADHGVNVVESPNGEGFALRD
jgi:hypothetical protein